MDQRKETTEVSIAAVEGVPNGQDNEGKKPGINNIFVSFSN